MNRFIHLAIALTLLGSVSCATIGPGTIPRDRFEYGNAIANSWKEQLLSNLIRMRYVEAPIFVDVASVINQYALEGEVAAGAGFNTALTGENTATFGGAARWADRPTITYAPITGKQFSISLLTPLPPESIFALVQSGWPTELILRLTVRSINEIVNARSSPSMRRDASPEFIELLRVWGRLREARALGLRKVSEGGGSRIVVYQMSRDLDDDVARDLEWWRDALELAPEATEFTLSYGLVPESNTHVAVLTTSMIELINELAWRADVPSEHVEEGRTGPTYATQEGLWPLIRTHYSKERPEDSYVSVQNRGYWFYIDDRDVVSKRTFAILQILLSLTEAGEAARGPVVTIGG